MRAIPTVYRGVRFRSRLEATWAAFFDLVGWEWRYEPIDLAGYIPDFVLYRPGPILVEVKPILEWGSKRDHDCAWKACQRIQQSGWPADYVVVGAGLQDCDIDGDVGVCIGMRGHRVPDDESWTWSWERFRIHPVDAQPYWAAAQNCTQWKP